MMNTLSRHALLTALGLCLALSVTASEPTDMDGAKTKNGKIAVDYINMRFNQAKMAEADKLYASPNMIDHGYLGMSEQGGGRTGGGAPGAAGAPPAGAPRAGGAPAAGGALKENMTITKVLVQGDLVFVQAHGHQSQPNGDLMWILYRIKDGKIVEHSDTHNVIPDSQVGKQW